MLDWQALEAFKAGEEVKSRQASKKDWAESSIHKDWKILLISARVQTSAVMAGWDILPWNISVVAEDLSQWKKQGINFDSIDQRIVIHIRQWAKAAKPAANVFCYKYRLLVIYVLMLSMGLRRPLIIWSLIFAQNMTTMTRPGLSTTF